MAALGPPLSAGRSTEAPAPAAALVAALPAVVAIAWALLAGRGGLSVTGAGVAGIGTALSVAALAALAAAGRLALPRVPASAVVGASALALYGALAALSTSWSVSPAASRDDALKAFVYLAAFLGGCLLAPVPDARRGFAVLTGALAVLTCAVSLWDRAFVGTGELQLNARLLGTIEHANGLAIVAVLGLLVAVAGSLARSLAVRGVSGAAGALCTLTLVLTVSRSGVGLAVLTAGVLVLLIPGGAVARVAVLLPLAPAAAAGLWGTTWPAFNAAPPAAPAAGARLVVVAAVVALAGAALALLRPATTPARAGLPALPAPLRRRPVVLVAALVVLLAFGVALGRGGTSEGPAAEGPGGARLVSLGLNQRDHWWGTAWRAFRDRPLAGQGAGTFRLVEQSTRFPAAPTTSPHNIVLQALAGTGLAGGALIVVAGVGLLLAAARGVAARREDALLAAALALGAGAVFAQALLEIDWDLVAVGVLATVALGVVAGEARERAGDGGAPPLAGLVAGLLALECLALAALLVSPVQAAREVTQARALLGTDPRAALRVASSARGWDGASVRPLLMLADAQVRLGDPAGARASLAQARELEPRNYEPLLRLARLQFAEGDVRGALVTLRAGYPLSGGAAPLLILIQDVELQATARGIVVPR